GLDNDGLNYFIENHLPYLSTCQAPILVSIAGRTEEEFVTMAQSLQRWQKGQNRSDNSEQATPTIAALELNISCPNVTGGVDYGTNATSCYGLIHGVRKAVSIPIVAKLTPNVTNITEIAAAAKEAGADAVALINTLLGMSIDWRKQKPMLGNIMGGLSGPAIKPVALRCVYQVASSVDIPIIGIGGIATIDDVMEFLVAGASAVQIGTANYYDPTVTMKLLDDLPQVVASLGKAKVAEVIKTLKV
ncbi:MAG: dihydroorotate dehydrogenase, partial [Pirellulaceae bacterium]|nr:dihydroorotate dehydrogenase [Pirellulaceae bacterium]